ncbi:PAS domain-containing protein [Leptospira sp. 96542]|nr:PAS domain-containing protein [Leptospira sp. 96542]
MPRSDQNSNFNIRNELNRFPTYTYSASIIAGEIRTEWTTENLNHISGYNLDEITKLGGWIHVILKEDIGIFGERIGEIMKGLPGIIEYRIRTKSGQTKWLRDYSTPLKDEKGNVVKILGTSFDISADKK